MFRFFFLLFEMQFPFKNGLHIIKILKKCAIECCSEAVETALINFEGFLKALVGKFIEEHLQDF